MPVKSSSGNRAASAQRPPRQGSYPPSGAWEQMWEAEQPRLPLLLLAAEFLESLLTAQIRKLVQLYVSLGACYGFICVGFFSFFFFWFFPPLPINLKKKITGFFCQWWEYRKGDCYVGGWTSAECVHPGQGWKGSEDGGEGWGPAKWHFHLWSPGEAWCRKKSKRGSGGLGWETSILVKGLRLWASHSTTLELSVLIYTMSGWPKWLPRSF